MSLIELLKDLSNKSIQLSLVNGKIKYSGPEIEITQDIIQQIRINKDALVKHFWALEKSNLIPIYMTGNKIPLVIVHGGNSVNFLPEYFKEDRPVINFLDLGSEGEKIPFNDIDELARSYIKNLKKLIPHGPYILCGFSFGGTVAVKIAEILLNDYHDRIPSIIMFDTHSPFATLPKEPNKIHKLMYLVEENKFIFLMKAFLKRIRRLRLIKKKIHLYKIYFVLKKPLPAEYRTKYILSKYHVMSKTFMPISINTDLLLFRSIENEFVEKNLGWDGIMNNIEIVELKGDHNEIIAMEENYKIIVESIKSFVEKYNTENMILSNKNQPLAVPF